VGRARSTLQQKYRGRFGAILFVEWSLVLAVGNACEATYIDNPDGVMYAVSWLFAFLLLLVL
jgi:hypothetical protein